MAVYRVYNLHLRSELEFPALTRAEGRVDVSLRFGNVRARTEAVPQGSGCFAIDAHRVFLHYPDAGSILIQDGSEIIVERSPDDDLDFLRMLLLGQVFGLLLHQRGLLTLHASSVAFGGQAIAFLGDRGLGKSTTAAALAQRGHPFVTDDVLALRIDDTAEAPEVLPGPSAMKLWSDTATTVTPSPEHLQSLHRYTEKRVWIPDAAIYQPLPLRALYVLGWGTAPSVHRVAPRDAFCAILRNTYTGHAALPTGTAPRQLRQCAALTRSVPVYHLERPEALGGLDTFVQCIEEHADSHVTRSSLLQQCA